MTGPVMLALLLLLLFLPLELRTARPLLDVRLFQRRTFLVGNLIGWVAVVSLFGFTFLLPQYLQVLRGLSSYHAGLLLAPQGLAAMVGTIVVGLLYRRVGARPLVLVGGIAVGINISLISRWATLTSPFALLIPLLIVQGLTLVLATCGIRRLGEAFESTPFHRSLLADSSEEEYHLKPCICSSSPRGMDTAKGMLTFITRLTELCLQSLHHRSVAWTKPETTSLLLGTLTDQARSTSVLVAENARLASTSDHPASPGETTCLYQEGPHAPGPAGQISKDLETSAVHRPGRRGGSRWHRQGFKLFWKYKSRAASLKPSISQETVALIGGDGKGQPPVGSRTHARRTRSR